VGSEQLARRFLHVNLNCESLDATEGLYVGQLGLSPRMRTDPKVATDGSILGIEGDETFCETSFLYDSRGGRAGCALEAIEFHKPPLKADPSDDPTRPGIRSTLLTVADLDGTATELRDAGITVSGPVDGLLSGSRKTRTVSSSSSPKPPATSRGRCLPESASPPSTRRRLENFSPRSVSPSWRRPHRSRWPATNSVLAGRPIPSRA